MPVLLKTLFDPWRKDEMHVVGASINVKFQVFWLNMVSRFVGFVIRVSAILAAGGLLALAGFFSAAVYFVWLGWPLISLALIIGGIINAAILSIAVGVLLVPASYLIYIIGTRQNAGAAEGLTPEAAEMLSGSKNADALLKAAASTPAGRFILARLGLPLAAFAPIGQEVNQATLLEFAQALAAETGDKLVDVPHLLTALWLNTPAWLSSLNQLELQADDLKNVLFWQRRVAQASQAEKNRWRAATIQTGGGIGDFWSSGATYTLERYSHDLSSQFANHRSHLHLFGKKTAIDALERILSGREGANAVLIGPAGVGKRQAVLGLAERMSLGQTVPALKYKRLLELDVTAAIAGATGPRQVEEKLITLFNEATRAGNVILYIDDLASLLTVGSGEGDVGSINASQVLLPYLQARSLHIVGTATPEAYREHIERRTELAGLLEKVELAEPNEATTMQIVEETVPEIEGRSQVLVTYQAVKAAARLADRYIHDVPFPEKAISLLDQTATEVSKARQPLVDKSAVEWVTSLRTEVPVGEAAGDEKQLLLNLEAELGKRVIGQAEALRAVADALRRARSGLARGSRPIGSFLFVGPTGVGKTETARALAATYFHSEDAMIRFDMSEYREGGAITRLIGAPGQGGLLTEAIRGRPFALVLFDEIEKAHPDVLNLLLQVLDDGRLTDGSGRTVDCKNTLIIATSNASAEFIREALLTGVKMAALQPKLMDELLRTGIFKPEFLNRFDGVIAYRPLTLEEVEAIVGLMLSQVEAGLKDKRIKIAASDAAIRDLAEKGFDPTLGARQMRRVIQDTVEDQLARGLLSGQIKPGDTLSL